MLLNALLVLLSVIAAAAVLWHAWVTGESKRALERLLDYQLEHYEGEWGDDGRPLGGPSTRNEIGPWILSSLFAAMAVEKRYLGGIGPAWTQGDQVALRLLADYRRKKRSSMWAIGFALVALWALMAVFVAIGLRGPAA
jgi:hypothetical protein